MPARPLKNEPRFFWQGLLILLPVGLLAGLGLLSLRQDRLLVQEEARERAREIAQQLSSHLGQRVANRFGQFELFAQSWDNLHRLGLASWPGNPSARDWEQSLSSYHRWTAEW